MIADKKIESITPKEEKDDEFPFDAISHYR